ncbi:MAG: GNAT family N-acetyltransferase [Breznakia sp.]
MIDIKTIKTEDFPIIAQLAKTIWQEHFTPIIGENQVRYMLELYLSETAIREQVNQEGYVYYGLYEKNNLIGFMAVVYGVSQCFLSKLYLLKNKRGKGYARFALCYLENETKQRGLWQIWLTCNKYNSNSIQAYKHMGFVIFDSVVNDIGEGYVMDDYYMRKELLMKHGERDD